jgi:hypothetical protein
MTTRREFLAGLASLYMGSHCADLLAGESTYQELAAQLFALYAIT